MKKKPDHIYMNFMARKSLVGRIHKACEDTRRTKTSVMHEALEHGLVEIERQAALLKKAA